MLKSGILLASKEQLVRYTMALTQTLTLTLTLPLARPVHDGANPNPNVHDGARADA